MAISFVQKASFSSYDLDGTFVVSKPTGTAQGVVMFTFVNTFNGAPPSVPSGWTLAKNQNNATPSLGTYVYWKVAGASEPSTYSWGLAPGLDLAANIAVHTYRGVDTTTPVGASVSAVSTTLETLASGNVSVTTPGSWLLAVSGCRHTGTTSCQCSMASMFEQTDLTAADTAGSFSRSMATYDSNGTVAVGTASRTAVVGGTTLAHTVILVPIRPQLDLAETLTDNFDDNSVNSSKWDNGVSPYTGTVSETNGRIQISDLVGGSSRKGLSSVVPYDLRGSYVQAQIGAVFTDSTSQIFPIRLSTGSAGGSTWTGIQVLNGNIRVSDSGGVSSYSATYSSTNHKFVRIRESGGTVFYDRSADGVSWTNMTSQTTAALGFGVAEVWLSIEHFNGAAVGSSSTAAVDNFNIIPVLNTANPSDTETLSDSLTKAVQKPRSASDTETLADSLTKSVGRNKSANDTEGLSDSVSVAKGFGKSASDTEGLADSLTAVQGHNRSPADTLGLSDALSVSIGRSVAFSDGLGLSDSAGPDLEIGAQDFTFDWEDGLGLSDSATPSQGFSRSATDVESLSDEASRVAEYSRSATDALSLSDTVVAGLSVPRSTEDSESLSDSHTAALDRVSSAADSVGLSDSLSVSVDHVVTATDRLRLWDMVHATGGASLEEEDVLGLSDSVSREAEYGRTATDALSVSDSLSAARGISRRTADGVGAD